MNFGVHWFKLDIIIRREFNLLSQWNILANIYVLYTFKWCIGSPTFATLAYVPLTENRAISDDQRSLEFCWRASYNFFISKVRQYWKYWGDSFIVLLLCWKTRATLLVYCVKHGRRGCNQAFFFDGTFSFCFLNRLDFQKQEKWYLLLSI